jgi:hypothetical protein
VPKPRSLVGKLLQKVRAKGTPTPPPEIIPSPPTPNPVEQKLNAALLQIQGKLTAAALAIEQLPYAVLKTALDKVATTLRGQLAMLDTAPDAQTKASRLMQVGEAITKLEAPTLKAAEQGAKIKQAETQLNLAISQATTAITSIPVVSARKSVQERLDAVVKLKADALNAVDLPGLLALATLGTQVDPIKVDAEKLKTDWQARLNQKANFADKGLKQLTDALKTAPASAKKVLKTEVERLDALHKSIQTHINAADAGKTDSTISSVYWGCKNARERVPKLIQIDTVTVARADLSTVLNTLKTHASKDLFAAWVGVATTASQQAAVLINQGEAADEAALDDAAEVLKPMARTGQKSLADFSVFETERTKVEKLVAALKKHKQAAAIKAEIDRVEAGITDARDLGAQAEGGWHRARAALAPLSGWCAQALALADKLENAAAQLPELTKQLKGKGIADKDLKRLAGHAHKLLVEENCTPEEAVEMAQSAGQFEDEGLDEPDALCSARVKKALLTDKSITPELAHEIGKNLRGRGTTTMEDLQCVATKMKGMPPKALKALNDDGIVTGVCRGPVTDLIPELVDVNPRGWGDQTWDVVPGCYMGDKKMVVVGTMDEGGQRKVPGEGEGPIPHGTPDLIGHEAGHAYDAAGGGARRNHVDFVAARNKDVTLGPTTGLTPGRDDYFMVKPGESPTGRQTGADGALSECFAESFALYFGGHKTKWPNLMKFWKSNPWGV